MPRQHPTLFSPVCATDRFFSPTWRELGKKPIEERALWTDSSSTAQGKLSLYVQILSPEEAAATPMDSLVRDCLSVCCL